MPERGPRSDGCVLCRPGAFIGKRQRPVGYMRRQQPVKRSGANRKKLPSVTRQQVLMEAGYKCGNPTCRHILTLELHHMVWVKDGGGNEPSNLLALCPNCHALHTNGHIPETAIRHWKGMLVALNHAFDRKSM